MTKKTPFYDVSISAGAEMRELFGYYLPWVYGVGEEAEQVGTRTKASLCDLDYMAETKIKGTQALEFVQKLVTANCASQKVGQIKYTAICNEEGNMIDDGTVWRFSDDEFVLISGDEDDFLWVSEQAKNFDVEIENLTSEWTTLSLQGPLTERIARKIVDEDLSILKYYHFKRCNVDEVEVVISCLGFTGERGFEFHFHPKYAEKMWNLIMEAGRKVGIVPCGQAALEALRQEAGYLLVGNEHNKKTNPYEVGIGFTVSTKKEDFNGKEALSDIVSYGLSSTLVWFKVSDNKIAKTGDDIYINNEKVGKVTSGSYSFTNKAGTAVGYIDPVYAISGVNAEIDINGEKVDAVLSVMPLYDPGDYNTKVGYKLKDDYSYIFDSMLVATTVIDENLDIEYHNDRAAYFFSQQFGKSDLGGRNIDLCHVPEQLMHISKIIEDFKSGKKHINFFMMPGDDTIPDKKVKVVHVPFYKDGEVAGIVEFDFESTLEPGGSGHMTAEQRWNPTIIE